jgi:RNA-directed DNA polymerase
LVPSKRVQSSPMAVWLVDPTKTPIRRHIKVKADANPFDPGWGGYFELRKKLKKARAHR